MAARFQRDVKICNNNINDLIGNIDDIEDKILSYEMALRLDKRDSILEEK